MTSFIVRVFTPKMSPKMLHMVVVFSGRWEHHDFKLAAVAISGQFSECTEPVFERESLAWIRSPSKTKFVGWIGALGCWWRGLQLWGTLLLLC